MAKKGFVYDLEVSPNFFLAVFQQINGDEHRKYFVYSDKYRKEYNVNQLKHLVRFIEEDVLTLVGFNNLEYDDLLIKHILTNKTYFLKRNGPKLICENLHSLSQDIIKRSRTDKESNRYIESLKAISLYSSLDLLASYNTVDRVSLKQIAINMCWPDIQDLPYHPDHILLRAEIPEVIRYCENDVRVTDALRIARKPDLEFRKSLGKIYNMNLINSNDTNIAKSIIRKFYLAYTGLSWDAIKDRKTHYRKLKLGDCISNKIRFMTQKYMRLRNAMVNKVIDVKIGKKGEFGVGGSARRERAIEKALVSTEAMTAFTERFKARNRKDYEATIWSKVVQHTVGLGGIHSTNTKQEFRESEEFEYIDADVTSFYPWVIVNSQLYPAHLGDAFYKVYRDHILVRRMEAKKQVAEGIDVENNKLIEKTLKISANATFGLTKNVYSWLFDPKVATSVCVNGELYLLMLIERLEEFTDCTVVYSNTDGITTQIPKGSRDEYFRICNQWMQATGFNLEFVNYKRIVLRDVNNYIITTSDPENPVKQKGVFATTDLWTKSNPSKLFTRGYVFPIISLALDAYYTHNIPVDRFITSYPDIFAFMRAERTSQKFKLWFRPKAITMDKLVYQEIGEHASDIKLPKSNRWIITNGNPQEGYLLKVSHGERLNRITGKIVHTLKVTNMQKPEEGKHIYVTITNDTTDIGDIRQLCINYEWYIGKCNEIINSIHLYRPYSKDNYRQEQLAFG